MGVLPLEGFDPSRTPSPEPSSTRCSSPGLTETETQCSTPADDAHEPETEANLQVENSPGKHCGSICYLHRILIFSVPDSTIAILSMTSNAFALENNAREEVLVDLYVNGEGK